VTLPEGYELGEHGCAVSAATDARTLAEGHGRFVARLALLEETTEEP
jgi:hypothetical protein